MHNMILAQFEVSDPHASTPYPPLHSSVHIVTSAHSFLRQLSHTCQQHLGACLEPLKLECSSPHYQRSLLSWQDDMLRCSSGDCKDQPDLSARAYPSELFHSTFHIYRHSRLFEETDRLRAGVARLAPSSQRRVPRRSGHFPQSLPARFRLFAGGSVEQTGAASKNLEKTLRSDELLLRYYSTLLASLSLFAMDATNTVTLEKDAFTSAHIDQRSDKGDEESFSEAERADQAAAAAADKTLLRKVSPLPACGPQQC